MRLPPRCSCRSFGAGCSDEACSRSVETGGLPKCGVHARLPARAGLPEMIDHICVQSQGHWQLYRVCLRATAKVLAHSGGEVWKHLGKGPCGGKFRFACLWCIRVKGWRGPEWRFPRSGHSSLLSLWLAGRMETTESPSAPSTVKTTAIVPACYSSLLRRQEPSNHLSRTGFKVQKEICSRRGIESQGLQ